MENTNNTEDYNLDVNNAHDINDINIDDMLFTDTSYGISFSKKLADIHNILLNSEYLPEFSEKNTESDYNYGNYNYNHNKYFNKQFNKQYNTFLKGGYLQNNVNNMSPTSTYNNISDYTTSYNAPYNYYSVSTDIPSYRYSTSECQYTPKSVSSNINYKEKK